jgi:hypothetical protein
MSKKDTSKFKTMYDNLDTFLTSIPDTRRLNTRVMQIIFQRMIPTTFADNCRMLADVVSLLKAPKENIKARLEQHLDALVKEDIYGQLVAKV